MRRVQACWMTTQYLCQIFQTWGIRINRTLQLDQSMHRFQALVHSISLRRLLQQLQQVQSDQTQVTSAPQVIAQMIQQNMIPQNIMNVQQISQYPHPLD